MPSTCPDCGSDRLLGGDLFGEGASIGTTTASFKPDDLAFRFSLTTGTTLNVDRIAAVCFDCGYLHSRVNVIDLQRCVATLGQESLKERLNIGDGKGPGADHLPTTLCLECGAAIPEDEAKCPDCGWSYSVAEE